MTRAPHQDVWMGVDLGTQSVRALAVTDNGQVLGRGSAPLSGRRKGERHEQLPSLWWESAGAAIRGTLTSLPATRVRGLAVCGTSGTVLLTDSRGAPVTPALMYDDGRARAEAVRAQEAGAEVWRSLGFRIQPSWGLPKLLWFTHPDRAGVPSTLKGARVCHQADFITARLIGRPVETDSSHALKTGYDLNTRGWPAGVHDLLGLGDLEFPAVVAPGSLLGTVCAQAAAATGLSEGTPVVAGMTDGCAAQLGSGAWDMGQWNTVLGTTLVLKGVTAEPLHDPAGVLYNHLSPDGYWLPGGASSVGAGVLSQAFAGADLGHLDRLASRREPAGAVAYPLVSRGERFPFLAANAEAFLLGRPADKADHYAALLQGVALVERLCLAYIRQLGAPVDATITCTGGATRSGYWNQLRADVMGRSVRIPEHTDPALGMAVLAAHGVAHRPLRPGGPANTPPMSAVRSMVRAGTVLDPRPQVSRRFAGPFVTLVDELERRGWLPAATAAYARENG